MITKKSIIRLGCFGLLAFAIVGTPLLSHAQSDTTVTNAVKAVKHKKNKKKKTARATATNTVPVQTKSVRTDATTATTPKAGHNKSRVLPFHGKLKAVDVAAETVSIGTRTFEINSDTIIIKDGKPATLADGVVGDETGGAYKKTEDGKLIITKLRFGAKTASERGRHK